MRLSSLVTLATMIVWVSSAQATSPPNLQEALKVQQAQADLHPDDPAILNDLGNLLVLAGSLNEAEGIYHQSLEIEPENTTTRYNLALVLMEQGHGSQAAKELHYLLELDPDHAWALYQLGSISASLGRRSKTVDFYTKALALNPELASPAVNPHIIENRYFTEAQLRLYLARAEVAQSPRLYQRPGQVAELLIPTSESEAELAPGQESDSGTESQPEARTLTWSEEPTDQTVGSSLRETQPPLSDELTEGSSPAGGEPEDSSRVLTEENLTPTNVGEGAGYVGSSGQVSPTGSTAEPRGTVSYPRTTTPRSGSPSRPAPPQSQAVSPQTVPPQTQPTPRSQSFVPTLGSTGRLELELLVEDSSLAVAPGP